MYNICGFWFTFDFFVVFDISSQFQSTFIKYLRIKKVLAVRLEKMFIFIYILLVFELILSSV